MLSLDLQSFLVHLAEYGFAPMLSWNADLLYWPNPNLGGCQFYTRLTPALKPDQLTQEIIPIKYGQKTPLVV